MNHQKNFYPINHKNFLTLFKFLATQSIIVIMTSTSNADIIQFNPEQPLYIEYHSQNNNTQSEVSLQIEDAKSLAKMRLNIQAKPNQKNIFYGYMWLQIGKKISNEVIFKKSKYQNLKAWLTTQDEIQALFLFENNDDLMKFKQKALKSVTPIMDKNQLPDLTQPKIIQASVLPSSVNQITTHQATELNEALKFEKLQKAYDQLTSEQKILNDKKANDFLKKGIQEYQEKKYSLAETSLQNSLKFNPNLFIANYYLGLCNYQLKKYEKSLTYLSLAEGSEYNQAEYSYYKGLNYLKLKNYLRAEEEFSEVIDQEDPDYSGAAAFFSGNINFQNEDYIKARKSFEYSIDHSKNPKMDKESESMLDKIDRIESFNNQMKERFKYNIFSGLNYDSNILNSAKENTTTQLAAYRILYGFNFSTKFFYNFNHDMMLDLALSDYYSLDSQFKPESTVQSADPLQLSASLPYHYRFQIADRIYTLGLNPSYQTISMSTTDSSRNKILDSTIINTDLNFSITEKIYLKFFIEYSIDKSYLETTEASNDLNSKKTTFGSTLTLNTLDKKKSAWVIDLNYYDNHAEGDNIFYHKIYSSLTYSQLGIWNAQNILKLDFAQTRYPKASIERTDEIINATLGLNKELTKELNLNLNAVYTLGLSNVDSYKYDKFVIQSLITYSGAF